MTFWHLVTNSPGDGKGGVHFLNTTLFLAKWVLQYVSFENLPDDVLKKLSNFFLFKLPDWAFLSKIWFFNTTLFFGLMSSSICIFWKYAGCRSQKVEHFFIQVARSLNYFETLNFLKTKIMDHFYKILIS